MRTLLRAQSRARKRQEAGVDAAACEIRVGEDRGVQAEVGGDAGDAGARDGLRASTLSTPPAGPDRATMIFAMQRVVEGRHARAGLDVRVDPDVRARRPAGLASPSRGWAESRAPDPRR